MTRSSLSRHFLFLYDRCGPLVRYWCMRFEGKHNYKDLAHCVCVCVCMCVCVCDCVCTCVRHVCVCACVRMRVCVLRPLQNINTRYMYMYNGSHCILYTLQYRPEYCHHYHSRRMSSMFFPNCHDESLVTRYKINNNYFTIFVGIII